jgi:alpha-galactosidase
MRTLSILAGIGRALLLTVIMVSGGCRVVGSARPEPAPMASATRLPFEKVLLGPVTDYEVLQADSRWGQEYILSVSRLSDEGFKIEGKNGRSCALDKPWLLIRNIRTQRGLAVSLAYSGNWRIEVLPHGDNTLLRAATLPESLKPYEMINGLPIPGALVAEFTGHWDNGAQPMTRFIRTKLLRKLGDDEPLIQYNTWYDRKQELDEDHLIETARLAAELGCELFVIDAGWYGRNANWSKAVGDWRVNLDRLPGGIGPIAEEVRRLGMKFGMWVEIESANFDSPVGKDHPDWYLRDGSELVSKRACLDFGNPEALAWARTEIDRIVTANRLDYIKMDFNTHLKVDSEKYAPQSDPLWHHYRGLAQLWDHIRARYPDLIVENCSSGSLRHDVSTAAHTDTHWVSDRIKNEDNLAMNFGATYLFPPESCNHWTCFPESSEIMDIQSCFTINMLGHMGLSGPIVSWDRETRHQAAECIALYKRIRSLIRNADVYHLTGQVDHKSPKTVQAVQYLDRRTDCSIVFAFHAGDPAMTTILELHGLKRHAAYRVHMPATFGLDRLAKGQELMDGLRVDFPHRGASAVIRIAPTTME